jgi:hypothetical protein
MLNRQNLLAVASVSATGAWYPIDFRNDPGGTIRTFTGVLTAGDTVYFEVTNEPVFDSTGTAASVSVIVTVSAFTGTPFSGAFVGPFSAIRFRKTGTTGPAIVNGIV